jgi:hypothetical protein
MTSLPPALDKAAFDEAVLGAGLPADVAGLIAQAGLCRGHDEAMAQSLLEQAQALMPDHPAPLIALYRHHFYGHRLVPARRLAEQALVLARRLLGRLETASDEQAQSDVALRFYLFALKGYAYLSLRLGDLPAGQQALGELRQLDPADRVGGAVLAHVLTDALARAAAPDADDDAISPARLAPRGWGV